MQGKSQDPTKRLAMVSLAAATLLAGPALADWSNTTPVVGVGGGCPIESRDGNALYTASGRGSTLDVWVYERNGRVGAFEGPILLGDPVSLPDAGDFCPTPLPGYWLLFVSDRPGGCGGADMYIARYRPSPAKSWGEARNLGCGPEGPNTTGRELSPSLVTNEEGVYLYYSTDAGGSQDIYRSAMAPDGSFGPGELVAGLNTGFADQQPNVSGDGLEIVFSSNRDGAGQDVFTATRSSVDAPWSNVRNLSAELSLPTVDGNETRASMSWDRKRLYYGSGGTIFVSER
jgi:hypothetical protein